MEHLQAQLRERANPEKAAFFPRFFKSGPGEYGEGDQFLGVTVPDCRMVARQHSDMSLATIKQLLTSPWHEDRLTALIILVIQYRRGDMPIRQDIYDFYLAHTARINNWDLVDLSCRDIVGWHTYDHPELLPKLNDLAISPLLWERRIAIVSTFYFLMKGDPSVTLSIAETLIDDRHDLIQKAVGWMLREMGKRIDQQILIDFLALHYHTMPRTTLRYAIERFNPETRKAYLQGTI